MVQVLKYYSYLCCMILRAYKYRLYPNTEQTNAIHQHLGCSRWLYNHALDTKVKSYKETGKSPSRFDIQATLPKLKEAEETRWLSEVNSQTLQASLENLDKAFTRFFKEKKGFPRFKSKHDNRQSFSIPQNAKVDFDGGKLFIPKLKSGINIVLHRTFEGKVKTTTISKTPTGKYFASVLVETNDNEKQPKKANIKKAIGVDLGIKTFATLSNGEQIENPKHLRKSLKRLKQLQRKVSKKVKGSINRNKARIALAKQHEKVSNQRNDFLHKVTKKLVSENQTVCLETLKAKNMMANHKLAQALSDIAIGKFNTLIEYKALWYGSNILRCGQFEASSKICNPCGATNHLLTLKDREWTCANCGSVNDRDKNASLNIRDFCFYKNNVKQLRQEMSDVKRVEKGNSRSTKHEAPIPLG